LHFDSRLFTYNCYSSHAAARAQTKLHIAYLTSWLESIFGYKLRIDYEQLRLKILKQLRTARLNSEFTGSYKKVYIK